MSAKRYPKRVSAAMLIACFLLPISIFGQQPGAPGNVAAEVDTVSQNLITWTDEASATGETYNIYISEAPIIDVTITGVVKVGRRIPEGEQQFPHTLFTPADTGMVSYYYAVTAVSAAGEENTTVNSGANTTTTAVENKAIATGMIALITDPVTIDGDISEFTSRTMPFLMDSSHAWVEADVGGDDDLSAKAYLMMDMENFYVAVDVTDEALVQNFSGFSTWNGDSFEFHTGLYPLPAGILHKQRFKRGPEPDYQFRFSINEETWLHVPWPGRPNERAPNHVVDYVEIALGPREGGYFLEARISFADLVNDPAFQSHPGGTDSLFVPEAGMVIPIDFTLSDADIDVYQGHIYYFWQGPDIDRPFVDPTVWSQAVIGDFQTLPTSVNDDSPLNGAPAGFTLSANYPNPFAVSGSRLNAKASSRTTIRYSLLQNENITITIYNILGQKVTSLVQGRVAAGEHAVSWNGLDDLGRAAPAGVYFYRLESSNVVLTRKLLLVY